MMARLYSSSLRVMQCVLHYCSLLRLRDLSVFMVATEFMLLRILAAFQLEAGDYSLDSLHFSLSGNR